MDSPNSESAYSTRGDTSGYTMRVMMPTASIERRLSVKTFWMILSEFCFSSLNRHGRGSRFRMINRFHLVPISTTVVATGQPHVFDFCGINSSNQVPDGDMVDSMKTLNKCLCIWYE